MQRLFEHFRTNPHESLAFPPPGDYNAARSYAAAINRVSIYLGGTFGVDPGAHMQLAILMASWMRGRPLSLLIAERAQFNSSRRSKRQSLAAVIRNTMTDVEQYARFEAPKYLGCYRRSQIPSRSKL